MGRVSDTRARVRAIADEMAAAGQSISSRKVLEVLGAGSLSTITDELKSWSATRARRLAPQCLVVPADGVAPPPPPVSAVSALASAPLPSTPSPGASLGSGPAEKPEPLLPGPAAVTQGEVRALFEELRLIREELAAIRKENEEQLAKAYQRYEAVQRRAMEQIDEARQVAAELKEKLQMASMDAQLREDAQRGKAQMLRDENVRLATKLEAATSALQRHMQG